MEREHLEFRAEQLKESIEKMRMAFFDVVNGLKPINEFEKAIKEWEEKRQIFNNKNIGMFLLVMQFAIKDFKITGDPAKDMGQVNKSKPGFFI